MSRQWMVWIGVFVIATTLGVLGCQQSPSWVAKVEAVGDIDEWVLSPDEFKDIAARRWINLENAAKQPEQDLEDYAAELALHQMKVIDGYNKGYGQHPEAIQDYQVMLDREAVKAMLNGEILEKLVTEDEIKAFYNHDREEVEVSHIMLKVDEDDTDKDLQKKLVMIRREAMNGKDFSELAQEYNEDESTFNQYGKDPNGYIGWTQWGRMVDPFQEAMFNLKPGEISEPVKTIYGWHLIKVHGKRQREIEPLEKARTRIIQAIAYRKQDTLQATAMAFIDQAMSERQFKLHEDNITRIYAALEDKKRKPDPLSLLTAEQQQTPLASIDDGKVFVTIRDVITQAQDVGPVSRAIRDEETLKEIAEKIIQNDHVLPDKAKALGYYEDPDAVKAARDARNRKVGQLVQRAMIYDRSKPSEDQAREFFEQHKDDYKTDPRFTLIEILLSDENMANELAARIRNGENMRQLAATYSERKTTGNNEAGILGPIRPTQYGTIGKKAAEAEMGELVGPFEIQGQKKWSLFKIIAKEEPQPQEFEAVRQKVIGDMSMQLRKDFQSAWEDSLRGAIDYKVARGLTHIFDDVKPAPEPERVDK